MILQAIHPDCRYHWTGFQGRGAVDRQTKVVRVWTVGGFAGVTKGPSMGDALPQNSIDVLGPYFGLINLVFDIDMSYRPSGKPVKVNQ